MVPKLHSKGTSFRGVGLYVLHDKDRATTSERVEWTDVRNLAVEDPHAACRVMASTAMSAERLKEEAGIKRSGRKSKDVVQHMTLSWHPDESEGLSREEMMRAAHGAIRALGAEDRQALIVAHNDEEQPHIHIVINRVSPEDGRLLPSSKERLNLSRWAQRYEEERGQILCEERVINNAARDRGEYTRGNSDTPRHIYELHAANDDRPGVEEIIKQQRAKDHQIGKRQRELKKLHAKAWLRLESDHKSALVKINEQMKRGIETRRQKVRDAYRDRWKQQFHEHQAERRVFDRNEKTILGRLKNRIGSAELKAAVRGRNKGRANGDEFDAVAAAGARLERLNKAQARRDRVLEKQQLVAEAKAENTERSKARLAVGRARVAFLAKRAGLVFTQSLERAKVRAEWRTRSKQREQAFGVLSREQLNTRITDPTSAAELARKAAEEFKKQARKKTRSNERDRGNER